MMSRFLIAFMMLLLLLMSYNASALEQCLAIFPSDEQTYGPELELPSFEDSDKSDGSQEGDNLALPAGDYEDIKVDEDGVVFFTELNNTYRMTKLEVGEDATAQFVAGDYFIESLLLNDDTKLAVVGSGTVRIYANSIDIKEDVAINQANGLLILIGYGDIQTEKELKFTGVMYANGDIKIKKDAEILGSVTGKKVDIKNPDSLDYQKSSVTDADFNGMCDNNLVPAIPIANYRFDECAYTGTAFEVIDQTGNYSATTFGSVGTVNNGQIERFANISDEDHHIETAIPLSTNFSISTWFKKPTSTSDSRYFVLGAMAAGGGDLFYVDRDNSWRWAVYDGVSASSGNYSFNSLDNDWHHLVLVYSSGKTQLYIDGVLEDSIDRVPTGTLKYIGTSFDQVNSSSPQGFRAPLDEFLVYDTVLTAANISAIYNNQLAENNYDGSARAVVSCSALLALYRFEQTDFSTQIDDTGGLNNHGENIFGGQSTADGKYCRGFESESWNDYNGITDAFRSSLDLNGDVGLQGTISFWFNSSIDWDRGSERVLFDASAGSSATDKYFVFEIQQDGRLKFAFEDSSDADFYIVEPSTNSRASDTWYYLTVTWDYLANDFAIYVDGTLQVQQTRNTNGAMGELLPIVFGDNSSDYTQSGNSVIASPYSSRGNYDEVRIYNKVLSQSEIQTDMNEDNGCVSSLIAEWRMDEVSWSGSAGEVIDETGSFSAQAINGAKTENASPALIGNPGTCGYGVFDGANDYLALPTSFENQQGSFTITAWIKPSNLDAGSRIFADDENNSQGYAFSLGDPGSGKLRFYSRGVSPISVDTLASVIPTDTWTFVAAVHNSKTKTREIYVNGVAQSVTGGGLSSTYSGNWGVDTGIASIGGETNSGETSNRFTGAIDEVRMYEGALSASEITAIKNETHPCSILIDHFEIDTIDGLGLTCQADDIIIKACADSTCSTLNTDEFTVELFVNASPNRTIIMSGGSIAANYAFTAVGNAALSINNQSYGCKNGSSTPCNVEFQNTGFVIGNENDNSPVIPTQLSGKPSDIGFKAEDLFLQAVKDDGTGTCVGLFPDGEDVEVNLSYACQAGSPSCDDNLQLINNNSIKNISSSVTPFNLRFGADSKAEFSLNYPEAGKLILNAQKLVEVEDEQGNKESLNLATSSNGFVVRPFGFYILIEPDNNGESTNPAAQSASDNVFMKAGEEFTTVLKAVQWQASDDSDNDGVPDIGADLSGNTITAKFGDELVSSIADFSHGLVAPTSISGGVLGNLTNGDFTNFTSGTESRDDLTYSEVGIISFSAISPNYLGATDGDITGFEPYVGRFTPDHFELTITDEGSLASVCDGGDPDMPFVYNAQMSSFGSAKGALQYLEKPEFVITAKSSLCPSGVCSTTRNYFDDFMKLEIAGIEKYQVDDGTGTMVFFPVEDAFRDGVDNVTKVKLKANYSDGTLTPLVSPNLGVLTFTYHAEDNFVYLHEQNSEIPPFVSDINVSIASITDEDTITANDLDDDPDASGPILVGDTVITLHPVGKEVRFGRAYLENSYGPETSNLPQPFYLQYLESIGNYQAVIDDTCTPWDASKISLTTMTLDKDKTSSDGGLGFFNTELPNGETRAMFLTKPDPTAQGNVGVEYDIYPWLKYDWTGDGNFTENPSAIATFGIFRGNDRIIYQREIQR